VPADILMFELLNQTSKKQNKPITKEQVAVLLHFCFCNALDLYNEAELLRKNRKYARAFYLCIVALEELAKIPLALNAVFLPKSDQGAWTNFWKMFNSHTIKQNAIRQYGQTFLTRDKFYLKRISEKFPVNKLKLASLYVDCLNGHPFRPNKIFNKESKSIASIFTVTKDRLRGLARLHSTFNGSIRVVRMAEEISVKINDKDFKKVILQSIRDGRQLNRK